MRNRHRKQHSVEPCRQQAIVRGLFEDLRGYNFSCIAAQIKIRSTLLTTERLVAASEERTSYIAFGNSRAGGASDCCARVPGVLVLLRDKST